MTLTIPKWEHHHWVNAVLVVFFSGSMLGMLYFELEMTGCLERLDRLMNNGQWPGKIVYVLLDVSCYGLLLLMILNLPPHGQDFTGIHRTKLLSGVHPSLILFAGLLGKGSFTKSLEGTWVQRAGKYSFGIYLFDMTMWELVFHKRQADIPHQWGKADVELCQIILMMCLTCAASVLSFRYFENPILNFIRRHTSSWSKRPLSSKINEPETYDIVPVEDQTTKAVGESSGNRLSDCKSFEHDDSFQVESSTSIVRASRRG